ncbi:Small GTPase superfamily, partial [Trinorchestia longiramus]
MVVVAGTSNIPVVVVGNKVDLEKERQVTQEEAEEWVKSSMTNATYVETSAKYNVNVKELFKQLLVCTYGYAADKS